MPPARSVRRIKEGAMTVSPDLWDTAEEVADWLRDLPDSDIILPEDLVTTDVEVAVPTRKQMLASWFSKEILVQNLRPILAQNCIAVGAGARLFLARAGVVLLQTEIKGYTFLHLKEKTVSCYEQVRASELAAKLTDAQLLDLRSVLMRIMQRKPAQPDQASAE